MSDASERPQQFANTGPLLPHRRATLSRARPVRQAHGGPSRVRERVHAASAVRDLFQPDVILPAQFFGRLRRDASGERRLLAAILQDAIDCFQKHASATGGHHRERFGEALDWMMSGDQHPFSFEHVCSVLGLDPISVREELQRWRIRRTHSRHATPV